MTQTNQNKDYSWQWLDETLKANRAYELHILEHLDDCRCKRMSHDDAMHAIQQKIDEHYIGKGEAEQKVKEERDRWVAASMKRLARFDETGMRPDMQAYVEQRCIEARLNEAGLWLDMIVRYERSRLDSKEWYKLNPRDVTRFYAERLQQLSTNNKDTLERSK